MRLYFLHCRRGWAVEFVKGKPFTNLWRFITRCRWITTRPPFTKVPSTKRSMYQVNVGEVVRLRKALPRKKPRR